MVVRESSSFFTYLFCLKFAFGNTQWFVLWHKSNFAPQNSSPNDEVCQYDWKLHLICLYHYRHHHQRLNWTRQNCSKAEPKTDLAPVNKIMWYYCIVVLLNESSERSNEWFLRNTFITPPEGRFINALL